MRRAAGLGRISDGTSAARGDSVYAEGSSAPFLAFALIALLALSLLVAPGARAATVTQRPVLFTIDGANVPDHAMNGSYKAAVDNATGAFYLSEEGNPSQATVRVFRFHPDGTLWPFPSTGLPYLSSPDRPAVAVDNSGGPNQSRIYVASTDSTLKAYDPSGQLLWNLSLPAGAVDVAIDPGGYPYVADFSQVRKYANTGSPPAELSSFPVASVGGTDVNSAGDVFLARSFFDPPVEKWIGGALSSTLDPLANDVYLDQSSPTGHIFTPYVGRDERQRLSIRATAGQFRLTFGGAQTPDLPFNASEAQITAALEALPTIGKGNARAGFTFDPSAPIAWQLDFRAGFLERTDVEQVTCQNGTTPLSGGTGCSTVTLADGVPSDVQEYDAGGTLLGTFGQGELRNARTAAYDPGLDRVYAAQAENNAVSPFITALGPLTTGTVGNATIEAPSAVGVATAHFSGTVNPQGTSSEWRFQWRKRGEGWATAPSSPPQSLPADSSDHAVEYTTNALRGSTSYQVRLVAVNTANQLLGASEPKFFITSKAAQAPAATIAPPSAITAHTARIAGTVNPQGDTADWRVQLSADPTCASGFKDQPLQQLSPSANSPVNVEYEATGLLPSQHYCARIVATNSAGSTTSTSQQFETLDALPTQVFAAYAAPRTDTTARINGYVNPEGSEATYRFEYSPDGSNWTTLPDEQTSEDRRQIVVASELSGLQPASTYHYRFTVETAAGPVQSDEKTFETRTTAEMQMPQRGIELVNKPNKGNQNISGIRPNSGDPNMVRADGNRVVWMVLAGAPEGNNGSYVSFLSTRTPSGWTSQSLAPPADQQVGGGAYAYRLNRIAPDFSTFLMRAAQTGAQEETPPTFLRVDDQQHQQVLKTFSHIVFAESYESADMTDDGAHVITQNPETRELEDIGSEPHEVVSIMPDGEPSECGVPGGSFYSRVTNGGASTLWRDEYRRMASSDAARLYFQSLPNGGGCTNAPGHYEGIYYRDRNAEETVELDAGTSSSPSPGLIRATPDGRSVFFVTAESHSPADDNSTGDVYRWDAVGRTYTCLTCAVGEVAVPRGQQTGFSRVLVSDDSSHVYFTSKKELVPGHGMPGETGLYSLSDGEVHFVAPTNEDSLAGAKLTPDGNALLFRASSSGYTRLTADRQAAECHEYLRESQINPGCQELFRYEDSTNSLECLSCLPGGETSYDVGELTFRSAPAAVSHDGSTVAFVTHERLLPEDINNGEDVYEWKNGALRLISDGETVYPTTGYTSTPQIYGMDATGDNIFFTLVSPGLTGYEQDNLSNLYDARIGGGFPRPSEPTHCSEESCQGSLAPAPAKPPVGSASLNGAGNQTATPRKRRCGAKRGKARQRCLHRKPRKHKAKAAAKRHTAKRSDRGTK
jgi:hypothetical protein